MDVVEETRKITTKAVIKVAIVRILTDTPKNERIEMLRDLADMFEAEEKLDL